jgi:hypothetical protein
VRRVIWINFPKKNCRKSAYNTNFYLSIFIKVSNIKYHENPSSRCRVVTSKGTDGRKDKEICAFLDFTNAYNAAYASFLSLSLEIFMSDLKNDSRTNELSHTPAISYLNL